MSREMLWVIQKRGGGEGALQLPENTGAWSSPRALRCTTGELGEMGYIKLHQLSCNAL